VQRILLVGNEAERSAILIACLEATGCLVGRAADVDELLERRHNVPAWDLIVVDGAPDADVLSLVASAAGRHRYDETMIRELLATSPDHISFKDLDGRFTRVSSSVARMFGLEKPEDAVGKSDFDFYPE
jgi:PAS domain-containing protein